MVPTVGFKVAISSHVGLHCIFVEGVEGGRKGRFDLYLDNSEHNVRFSWLLS